MDIWFMWGWGGILLIFVYYIHSIFAYLYASEEVRDGLVRLFRHNIMVILDKNEVRITVKYLRNFGYNDKKREEIKKSWISYCIVKL